MIAHFAGWTFDSDQRLITGDRGELLHLTPKAFDLLTVLIEAAPRVVKKDELHRRLWPGVFVSDATLAGLVKEVRRAFFAATPGFSIIRTCHGVGYAFSGSPDRPASRGEEADYWVIIGNRRILLHGPETVIGRDASADVRLDAAGVSRRHARIVIQGDGAYLEDLGSKNGTRHREMICRGPVVLQDGDEIWIGPVAIVFRASGSALSTEILRGPSAVG